MILMLIWKDARDNKEENTEGFQLITEEVLQYAFLMHKVTKNYSVTYHKVLKHYPSLSLIGFSSFKNTCQNCFPFFSKRKQIVPVSPLSLTQAFTRSLSNHDESNITIIFSNRTKLCVMVLKRRNNVTRNLNSLKKKEFPIFIQNIKTSHRLTSLQLVL